MKNFSQDLSEPGSSQNSSNERNEAHIDNTNINEDNDVLMTGTDEDSKSSKSSNANTNDPSNPKTYSKYNLLSILNEPSPSSPSYSSYNSLREQCDSQTHTGSGSSSSQANDDNDDDLYATPSSSSRRSGNTNYADAGSSSRNRNVEPSDEEMVDTIDNPHEMSDTDYYPSNSRSYDDDDDDDDEDDNDDDDDDEEEEDDDYDDDDDDDDENDEENVVENMDEEDDETQDFRSDRDLLFRTLRGAFGFPESALSSFGMSDQLSSSIEAITQQDDPSTVLTGLQTLAEVLLMSNEDFLNQQLQVQKVLDALVSIMSNPLYEDNIQMIIMACRCLSNLLDANPSSLDRLSYSKVVKALCEKLFEIQYIDVAELALTALRKISRCQTNAILENGGLTACLSYLDFFSLSTQRIATEIVANTLRSIPTKYFDSVKDAIPLIENLLGNTDKEIMKNISTAICGIVENFKFSADKIEALITPTVSKKLFSYLDPNIATEAMITPTVIKAVGVIVKVSSKLTKTAIESHLISNLYQILTKHAPTFDENDNEVFLPEKNNSTIIQSLIYTSKDILLNSLTVILNIFPSVGADSEEQKANPYRVNYSSESEETNAKERGEYLLKLSSISTISAISMSLLIDVFSSTVDIDIRRMVLQSLIKITHFLPPDVLYKSVQNVELSSLLSSIISQEDHPTLVLGSLDIACNLISKLPSFYAVSFFRGGIISEIETLLEKEREKEKKKEEEEKAKKALEEDKSQQIAEESEEADKTTTESGIETPTLLTRVNSSSTSTSSNRNLERSNTDDDEDEELDDDDDEDDEEEEDDDDDENDDDYDENEEMERRNISISSQFQTPSFYTDLSPLIVQEATCILSIYESQLETENFSSEIKEKFNQLVALEEKIRNRDNLAIQFNQLFELIPGVSQFELLRSHILRSLLTVLTTGTESDILNAQKTFMQCAIKDNFQSFETLINHLNDSLSRFERFEVLSSETSVVNSTPESIRRQFARQVKINLVPLTPKPPKKQKSIVISTQAIASLKAIDDFYKQKVQTESDHFSASTSTFTQILDSTVPENTTATSSSSNLPTSGNSSTTSVNSTSNENTNNAGPSNSGSSHASDTESIEQSRKNVKIEDISVRNSHSNDFNWHLDFYLDGKPIPTETTIYGAIYKSLAAKEEEKKLKGEHYRTDITQLVWSRAHVINFKKKPGSWVPFKDNSLEAESIDPSVEVPKSFGSNASLSIVVRLLNTLFRMNSNLTDFFDPNTIKTVNPVALTSFSSSKLTAKLNRQLEEPLIVVSGIVPQWTVDACRLYPFLFPFETRHLFLQSTSFGHSRLMNKWQNEINERNRRSMDRIPRQKVRISRDHMFYNGIKLMELYGSSPYALEVEFFDDVGTGLGPTLEFYTTFSKDFTQKSLNMWRNDDGDSESKYVFSKNGLFPKPHDEKYFSTKQGKHLLSLFRSLGIFVARSLIDSRIIDLNFNPLFFRISQFGSSHQNIGMLSLVDKQLENSMKFLERFVEARDSQGSSGEVKVDNSSIDDLSLDFTLPGQSDIELVPGGSNINVNIDNVDEYIKLVLDMTLGAGIAKQIASFKEGISTIMPYSALHSFTPEELVVLCGQEEADWTYETLCTSIKADHGYTLDSPVVQYLLEVMAEFTKEERKAFLQFSTGSRNLPIGGFPSLRPPFTVVCRDSDPPYTPNDYLPTVMTCVNYFKLPNYSSKEILRERLLIAMNEGSGCFLLS